MADSEVPQYQIPYQFGAVDQDDTFNMAVNLYLSDVMTRVVTQKVPLERVIAADIAKSVAWHKETYPERKDT